MSRNLTFSSGRLDVRSAVDCKLLLSHLINFEARFMLKDLVPVSNRT